MERERRGFSAIELIVIIIAALILAAILLPALAGLREDPASGALWRRLPNQTDLLTFELVKDSAKALTVHSAP